jgi:hypothetical protein
MPYFHFLSTYAQKASTWNDSFIYTFMSPNRKYFLTVGNECIELGTAVVGSLVFSLHGYMNHQTLRPLITFHILLQIYLHEKRNTKLSHPYLNTEHRTIGPISAFTAPQSVFSQYGNSDYLCNFSMIPALSYL